MSEGQINVNVNMESVVCGECGTPFMMAADASCAKPAADKIAIVKIIISLLIFFSSVRHAAKPA